MITFALQMIKKYYNKRSLINKKSDSYCFGGRHRSSTVKSYGDITSIGSKVLIGYFSLCNRKKSITVSDKTFKAEGLSSFFKNLGKLPPEVGKKLATNALKNPGRFLEIGANVATAAASRNPQAALSTLLEIIKFYHTDKGLCPGKFV